MSGSSINDVSEDKSLAIKDDYHIDYCFDDYESPDVVLDENGFPSYEDRGQETLEESVGIGVDGRNDDGGVEKKERSNFASDFYSCGAEWSCLVTEDHVDEKNGVLDQKTGFKGKMKQANLFQMWGLEKKLKLEEKGLNNFASSKGSSQKRKRGNGVSDNRQRVCPFYKRIPGTQFTVDAFRYGHVEGCLAYFLSHFHYDHYGGLSKRWSNGPIYCTPITARLVRLSLSVNPLFICPLELNVEHVIEGIRVTMLEANHCPGASLIHFRFPDGKCYLHTGDFRACKLMQSYPLLLNHRVNLLYLDTTYCNPKYKLPSKEDVLSYVVRVTKNCLKRQPKTLVVVGAYSIGKESVYLAISKALEVKIFANASRRRILHSFDWPELSRNLCSDGKDTLLHVLPISSLRIETLKDYLKTYINQYAAILAFRPTGWTHSETIGNQLDLIKPISKGNVTLYGVPYSEHSSFTELQEFVQFLRPDKIIPTVNIGKAANRDKMESYFRHWLKG